MLKGVDLTLMIGPFGGVEAASGVWDKGAHFVVFGLILWSFGVLFRRLPRLMAAVLAIALGGAVEVVQGMVGRDASWGDLLADSLGIATAHLDVVTEAGGDCSSPGCGAGRTMVIGHRPAARSAYPPTRAVRWRRRPGRGVPRPAGPRPAPVRPARRPARPAASAPEPHPLRTRPALAGYAGLEHKELPDALR